MDQILYVAQYLIIKRTQENYLLYRHISCRLQTVLDNISHSIVVMRRVFLLYLIIHKAYNKHV